jgi:MOSC domain-containing protein YiiM
MSKIDGTATLNSGSGSVVSIQVGRVGPLSRGRVPSGFVKRPVIGPVMVKRLGLAGDQQADLRVHGGPDKAIYCYPMEHYAKWLAAAPSSAALLVPGGFGENLTIHGFDEERVCIGDVLRIGGVTAQVTQPRQPCFKLGLRFGDRQMLRAMVRSGLSGWYLRVLDPGPVEAGASITTIDRPNPAWSITRLNRLIARHGSLEEIAELTHLPGLASDLRNSARAVLALSSGASRTPAPANGSGSLNR